MKNTTKKIISLLLSVAMLVSMLAMSAFAEELIIVSQPTEVSCTTGDTVTFTVEVGGELNSIEWYCVDVYGDPYLVSDEIPGATGYDTTTLQLTANCNYDGYYFYCNVHTSYGATYSDRVGLYVDHDYSMIRYDETTHLLICADCVYYVSPADHDSEDGVCETCGYDPANPVAAPPFIVDVYNDWADAGDSAVFSMEAYGLDLTYQWYLYEGGVKTPLEGETNSDLVIENVTCDMDDSNYYCAVTNAAGTAGNYAKLYVSHVFDHYEADGFNHKMFCVCGDEMDTGFHSDADVDAVCDECNGELAEGAPVITAQPENVVIQNGEDATYTVVAEGEDLSYQWFYDGSPLTDNEFFGGSNTPTFTVYSVYDPEDPTDYDCTYNGDSFYCVITNTKGAIKSETVEYEAEHLRSDFLVSDAYMHYGVCICGQQLDEQYHRDFGTDGICDVCEEPFDLPFTDLTPNDWFYDAAMHAAEKEIFIGEYGRFNGNDNITRGQAVTVLGRTLLSDSYLEMSGDEFEALCAYIAEMMGVEYVELTDLNGSYYDRYAQFLVAFGVVTGYEDGSFRGENDITRQELATMLARLVRQVFDYVDIDGEFDNALIDSFADADEIDDWAADSVELCRKAGLFNGDQYGNFNPTDNATRAEMAQILNRFFSV